MGNFNKFDKNRGGGRSFGGGGGRSFGGGGHFGGHSDGPRQMFPATCGECGQSCEVPFRPSGDRPVLCSNCFKGKDGGRDFAPKSFGGNKFAPKSFDRGNRGGFGGGSAPTAPQASGISKAQFDALSAKVDRILSILIAAEIESSPKAEKIPEKAKKEIVIKKETAKKEKAPAKKAKGKKK
ncbi:MAG: CxxC-x17-CxxC domain-containing protein [Patescibacteria group bacterium]